MSKISLKPNDSGTGTFTLEAPNSNTNRTLSLPDATGTVATVENLPAGYTDADALDLFNATGSAPVYACRAWVNFDGTGTVSIRASGNVSSITDNGVGVYTVNFATAMPDVDFALAGMSRGAVSDLTESQGGRSTTTVVLITYNTSGSNADYDYTHTAIFR